MNIKTKLIAIPSIPNKNICVPIGSMLAVQYFYEKLNFSDIFNKHKSKGLDLNSLLIGLVSYKLTENFSIKEAGKWLNQGNYSATDKKSMFFQQNAETFYYFRGF